MAKKDIDISKYFKPNLDKARKRTREEVQKLYFQMSDLHRDLGNNRKFFIKTHGCQSNEADTEVMEGIFLNMGFTKANNLEEADIILINTCAIRETAENKVWGELGRLAKNKRNNPDLIIGVCGCMTQEPKTVERILQKNKHVDIVFGTHNIDRLPYFLETAFYQKEKVIEVFSKEGDIIENLPKNRSFNHKAWVNIMYGCNEFCTFCIVPYTRGKERSRQPEEIIKEVQELVDLGYKEVTLLGQNVDSYGIDFKNGYTLGNLLYDLDKTGIKRLRFTTSYPRDLDLKTIQAMGELDSVMPHLHFPVQSGSNKVLKKMNRHYTVEEYLQKIELLRKYVPDVSITTDIIVAFPGETEEDFNETLELVKKVKFEGAFSFIYSPREGTPAASYENNLTLEEKKDRLKRLNILVNEGYKYGSNRFKDQIVEVLVDGISLKDENMLAGYTRHNKLINFKGDKSLIGEIVKVKVTKCKTWSLDGELCE